MSHHAVIQFLCVFGVCQRGLTALIETQRAVMAAVGGEARLSCLLTQPKDVLQVTWQKPLPVGEKTVATYNKHFGQKVNPDFRDKVEFEAAGLQNSSIVIRKVTEQDEGCYQCLFNCYPEGALTGTICLQLYGLTALIETQRAVLAAVGGEARLSCLLMQPKDVLQVTWQKPLPEGEKTVATFNKHFGQKVNPDFRDKVEFEAAGLQNSSIVIRKVTEQDEGCYRCLFNSYPEGANTGTTCLTLYELHEPILHVGESNSAEEPLVSCSATGRPAPTVTLSVLPHNGHFSNHSSVRVTNTNGTVTVTTTAVLSRLHDNSIQVGCAARVLSALQIEVLVMIPEVKQSSAAVSDEESGSDERGHNIMFVMVLFVIVAFGCVSAVITVLYKNLRTGTWRTTTRRKQASETLMKSSACGGAGV